MKYLIIVILIINSAFTNCFSQENSARILEIKKMYGEVIKLSNSITSKNCKTGKVTDYQGFDENSEKMPFEQKAEYCNVSADYSTYKAKFSGYEWSTETVFYLKGNKIFFVFMSSNSEACSNEYRIYYDLNRNVIKILNKSNDCDGDKPLKSSEIQDKAEIKSIINEVNRDFNKAMQMLK
jgi:hypothetical protein